MRKAVLLLAVSCKHGGLCPGGLDLDNPTNWIRIVQDDGESGPVQGHEIDFAEPLEIIEFEGSHRPQGKQVENWVIKTGCCRNIGRRRLNGLYSDMDILEWAYRKYGYHGFWGNYKPYLIESEFECIACPTESILKVTDVRIYKNQFSKSKVDFNWSSAKYRITGVSLTDQNYYSLKPGEEVVSKGAYIIISIPKSLDDWTHPEIGERRAYKFVSKVFPF